MLNKIENLEAAFTEFAVSLRMGDGFDKKLYQCFLDELSIFKNKISKESSIPKKAVSLFIDIYPALSSCSDLYSEDVKQRINESLDEILFTIKEMLD